MGKVQKGLKLRNDFSDYYANRTPLAAQFLFEYDKIQDVSIQFNTDTIIDLSIYVNNLAGVTKLYVDGSLAARDVSIEFLWEYDKIQDASILALAGVTKIYVDGSLAARDVSIEYLDASVTNLYNKGIWEKTASDQIYYNNGNVGIGLINPNFPLSVYSNSTSAQLRLAGSTQNLYLGGNWGIGYTTPTPLAFKTTNLERMIIDPSGLVGIGTTNPERPLHIKGANPIIRLESNATGSAFIEFGDSVDNNIGRILYQHTNNSMQFNTNDIERMRIDSSGSVGIGTTTPQATLDVSGDIRTNSVQYNTNYTPAVETEGLTTWNASDNTINIVTGLGPVIQVGQEFFYRVHNNTGSTLLNGRVVHPDFSLTNGVPNITYSQANNFINVAGLNGILTSDISHGFDGFITSSGKVRGVDTSYLTAGTITYVSEVSAGYLTSTKPEFPNYAYDIGFVSIKDAINGEIVVARQGDISDTFNNFWNGVFREPMKIDISTNAAGTQVFASISPQGTNVDQTLMFSDGFTLWADASIVLTPGTDTNPQLNYVYIPESTKVLTISTSDWPTSVEHVKLGTVYLQSASTTLNSGPLKMHQWNDSLEATTRQGHLSHITEKIRQFDAQWHAGTEGNIFIDTVATPDDVFFSNTSGTIYQLHRQAFPAFDMSTGSHMHVVNHSTTSFLEIANINTQLSDALGATLNNKSFSFVIWGVASSNKPEYCQLMLNLPTGSYSFTSPGDAVSDALNYSVYNIPKSFQGTGFLIGRYTFTYKNDLWVLYDSEDLRGKVPNTTAGGGGGGAGVTSFTGLTDTPSAYANLGKNLVQVNSAESALEFSNTIDISTINATQGFLGIGTTNPTSKLMVVGDVDISSGNLGVGISPSGTHPLLVHTPTFGNVVARFQNSNTNYIDIRNNQIDIYNSGGAARIGSTFSNGNLNITTQNASGSKIRIALDGGTDDIDFYSSNQNLMMKVLPTGIDVSGGISAGLPQVAKEYQLYYDPSTKVISYDVSSGGGGATPDLQAVTDVDNSTTNDLITSAALVSSQTDGTDTASGLSLYSDSAYAKIFGVQFLQTSEAGYGIYGQVDGDWATYFNMSSAAGFGWIFRSDGLGTGVASISNEGELTTFGTIKCPAFIEGTTLISQKYEPSLGTPSVSGYVLSKTTAGVKSWVAQSGSAVWGSITGNLEDQTDVSTAIDLARQWELSGNDIYNGNSGNVGIGTSSPANILHVDSGATDITMRMESDNSQLVFTGTSTDFRIVSRNAADSDYHNFGIKTISGSDPNFLIDTNGNVGIGTIDPSVLLHVYKNTDGAQLARFEGDGSDYVDIRDYGIEVNRSAAYFRNIVADGNIHIQTHNGTINQNRIFIEGDNNSTTFFNHNGTAMFQMDTSSGSGHPYFRFKNSSGANSTSIYENPDLFGGNVGSLVIDSGATGGYEGYSIAGRVAFVHDDVSIWGIYNDVNNQWMIQGTLEGDMLMPNIPQASKAHQLYYDEATGAITYDVSSGGGGGAVDASFFGLTDVSIISPILDGDAFIYNETTEEINNTTPVDANDYFLSVAGGHVNGDVSLNGSIIMMPNLPTSDPTNEGQLWNDSGTLKISAG